MENNDIKKRNLLKMIGLKNKELLPLIEGCLKINPKKRLTA